jgi:N-acetylmuramoyl-L-alanine amidase
MNKVVMFGTAHLDHPWIPGKCSPDGEFKEAIFSRELVKDLLPIMQSYGFISLVDYPGLTPDGVNIKAYANSWEDQQRAELNFRVRKVNEVCKIYGKENVIYVSLHVNASGNGQWMKASGWEIFTSPGQTKSDVLATCMWNAANIYLNGESKMRSDWSDGDPDKEAAYMVLTKTKCPAVLVENLFMDNKEDLNILKSDIGFITLERIIIEGILNYWLKI